MAEDISRRIDDLLSGAIDEQVREQRVLNDMMVGVRDGVSRLVGDVAALSARVTEARETSQGLREELPFLVQREVGTAVNSMSVRIDVLETAVGELVASLAGLEDRVGPEAIVDGVADKLAKSGRERDEKAGSVTAEAARLSIEEAADSLASSFDAATKSMSEMVEKHHAQTSRRLSDVKKWADDLEGRMRALEKALEANVKMPAEVRKQLNELTGATQDMTDSMLEEIRVNAESAAARIAASVEGLDREAVEMNRRFAEMTDGMRSFQEQILAYLQVRDVALEERRDQIVTELLSDFFSELPAREHERTVGRLRSVFARRRDRRDAERYRTGGEAVQLPAVPPEAVARAQADLVREQRRAERPWSAPEPAPQRTPERSAPAAAGETAARAAAVEEKPAKSAAAKKTSGSGGAKAAAKKSAAKKPAKKSASKKAATSKPSGEPAASDAFANEPDDEGAPEALAEMPAVPESIEPEPDAPTIQEVAQTGEIEIGELHAFADSDEDEGAGRSKSGSKPAAKAASKSGSKAGAKKTSAKKPAAAKPSQAATSAPEPGAHDASAAGDADSAGDAAEASSEPGGEAASAPDRAEPAAPEAASASGAQPSAEEAGEDTLTQALARVQALVDQHRKPPGSKKR